MTPPKIGLRLHYRRAASCRRRAFTRIQPRVVCGLDHRTARLLREIGWYAGSLR
jgi:hypothetical protein